MVISLIKAVHSGIATLGRELSGQGKLGNDYIHPSTDGHPANNTSKLPLDSPPDGTNLGIFNYGGSNLSKSTPTARMS
jgi:hypothetical protein